MKKHVITLMLALPVLFSMIGCERDLMDYEGENSIYFDVRYGVAHIDSSLWARHYASVLNLINEPHDTTFIKLRVATAGKVVNYDRPFSIEFLQDSSTAEVGVDFDFVSSGVIPAGEVEGFIPVQLYRDRDKLLDTNRIMMFRVMDNEHFTTRLTFDEDLSGRYALDQQDKVYNPDPRFHTIEIKVELEKPAGWKGMDYPDDKRELGLFGGYTPQKYMLMMEVLEMTVDDFAVVPSAKATAMGQKFAAYLKEQYNNGTPAREKDGRLMWVNGVTWNSYVYE